MIRKIKRRINYIMNSKSLNYKIRLSYLLLTVPLVVLIIFAFYNMFLSNIQYESMINSVVKASEFSRDFKKDFDYETYLIIVENKSLEESQLDEMLSEAKRIVGGLRSMTTDSDNMTRLNSIQKYLDNLETYKKRIEENIKEGNRYEDNMEIWENDVQIVTALVRDTVSEYIYFEIKDLQQSRDSYQAVYLNMLRTFLFFAVIIVAILIFASIMISKSITRPIKELSEVTDKVAKGDLSVRSEVRTGEEVSALSDSLNSMIDKINELIETVKEEQVNLRKTEFKVLQAQINPHFLYNTLDTIVWLAESGDEKRVVEMVENLSNFFRTSLNQGKDIISISEELMHVRSYLSIQKVRYQDILNYDINVPDEVCEYRIPKITIQPLVENALYHGIKNKRGGGTIFITGDIFPDRVELVVRDDGIGMEEDRLKEVNKGIMNQAPDESDIYGLYNVNERIRLDFGDEYGIRISSVYGEGTSVKIVLPIEEIE